MDKKSCSFGSGVSEDGKGVRNVTLTLVSLYVGKTEYSRDVYSFVESIAGKILEEDAENLSECLEEEFGIEFYPLETEPETSFHMASANKYMRASFGISSFLAEEYIDSQDTFFERRVEDFAGFEEDFSKGGSGHTTENLIQYANLYNRIADEEGIELDVNPETLVLRNKSTMKDEIAEMLREFDSELQASEVERLA